MTDTSITPEAPNAAETINFLRRFSDLMSNGYNASYLVRAADLLETLTARMLSVSDQDDLWRYKYETLSSHADALEAECDALRQDIEGHLDIASSILAEREALRTALQAREAEFSELDEALSRERGEFAAKLQAHEDAKAELRAAFDREREALEATVQKRAEEIVELRLAADREQEQLKATATAAEQGLAELRLAFDRERNDLKAGLTVRENELAALRTVSERENGALRAKVAELEAKRVELRSAFDRIGDLRNQANGHQGGADLLVPERAGLEAAADPLATPRGDRDAAVADTDAVVPKTTLRQARAQFEYLAREFIPLGDIASQVMCELGAYTMDLALVAGQRPGDSAVGEVARSILAPATPPMIAEKA
jgi:DNA repair exonuclease SbcCD ATPase subunit